MYDGPVTKEWKETDEVLPYVHLLLKRRIQLHAEKARLAVDTLPASIKPTPLLLLPPQPPDISCNHSSSLSPCLSKNQSRAMVVESLVDAVSVVRVLYLHMASASPPA